MNGLAAIKFIWYKPAPNIWLRCKLIKYSMGVFFCETLYTGEEVKGYPKMVGSDGAIIQAV